MLKQLKLKNLVLVKDAEICFENGFTVITGETGAGKTALIEGLRLILGERSDPSKVRKGAEKALIRAVFEPDRSPILATLFEEFGIEYSFDEPLIITREISSLGKSKAFVSGQLTPLSSLQKIAPYLVEFIGQHAQVLLKSPENQRFLLDQYDALDLANFQSLWKREKTLAEEITLLSSKRASFSSTRAQEGIKELESLGLNLGEEEELFAEFSLLSNSEETTRTSNEALLSSEEALKLTFDLRSHLEKLMLKDALEMAKDAHLQLFELQRTLQSFRAKMDSNPQRLSFLDDRLKAIDNMKKKYGNDLAISRENFKKELAEFEQMDEKITDLVKTLDISKLETVTELKKITLKRQKAALTLSKELSETLKELNIPTALVEIIVETCPRTSAGEDRINFMLRANKGEKMALVKECSSGGELSRLLFALRLSLAKKNKPQTLIFDEIDANVGGETATLIGHKLKDLALLGQVLCITHFPQVARQGDQHVAVSKNEKTDRTLCDIKVLDRANREKELLRMLGGELNVLETSSS